MSTATIPATSNGQGSAKRVENPIKPATRTRKENKVATITASDILAQHREKVEKEKQAAIEAIDKRLAELGDVQKEIQELEAAKAEILGRTVTAAPPRQRRASSGPRKSKQERLNDMLSFLRSNPGSTQAAIAEAMDVTSGYVAGLIKEAREQGLVTPQGQPLAVVDKD